MVTYRPITTASCRLVGGVVGHAGIVAPGAVEAASVAASAEISVGVSEGNVVALEEGREAASVGMVMVIGGAMESGSGVVVAAAEVVDAEDIPKVGMNILSKHRHAFCGVDVLLPTKKRASHTWLPAGQLSMGLWSLHGPFEPAFVDN